MTQRTQKKYKRKKREKNGVVAANQSQRAKLAYYEEAILGRKYVLRAAPLLQLTLNYHRGLIKT